MPNNSGKTLPLITSLYKICFYNAGFIDSNDGPFTIQEMQLQGKARLRQCGLLGEALGQLDLLVT